MNHVRKLGSMLVAAGVLALSAGMAQAAPHPFNVHDLVTLDRVTDPRVSPDGNWVIYDLRTVDYAANKSAHSIWIAATKAKVAPRRLAISDGGTSSARWSPDGKSIYFLSGRSGSDQVWKTDVAGATATQVTKLPLDVGSFRLSPDGKRILVSMAVFPDCDTPDCTKGRVDKAAQDKATGKLFDHVFIRHWDQWADGTKNHVFALSLDADGVAAGAAVDLMRGFDGDTPSKPFGDDADYVLTPDGSSVIFSARVAGKTEPWSTNFDLWRAPVDGSAPAQDLTPANPAEDVGPVISPDGSKVAYRAMKRATFEADRLGVWVMDLKSGETHEIDPAWDRSADAIAWAPDGKSLYVSAEDVGQGRLYSMNASTGAVRALTGDGRVAAFDAAAGTVVVARDNLASPADLYRLAAKGEPIRLTSHNADRLADIRFGGYEQFSFPGWNGETVHGYLVKPVNFDPAKKYPVAFLIHGGPQGTFGNLFHYRWNAQTYAGAGYAVVMIDFHGSTGYGQAFTDAISQHWGDRPLEDLQKGWAYALAHYGFLDGDRACALGGSYGGFMVNWIAGVWQAPWKCLVSHDGIFDNREVGYATEEMWFSEWENGGTQWSNPQGYERFNPVNHVGDWSVPELVVHSQRDYRLPVEQGIAAFQALQRKGVPSQFLYFPDENHWVLKPQNSVQWHETVEAWLNRWTAPKP